MSDLRETVNRYVAELSRPGSNADWLDLVHLGQDALPHVIDSFRECRDNVVRRLLVTAIWQYRVPSSASFLGELLRDADPEVRKEALDGLVTLGTSEVVEILRHENAAGGPLAGAWIDEALEQIREADDSSNST